MDYFYYECDRCGATFKLPERHIMPNMPKCPQCDSRDTCLYGTAKPMEVVRFFWNVIVKTRRKK